MKKIIVNQETCIGCGACIAIDEEHFEFNSEGKSEVTSQENIENNNNLTNAIESCPVAAISVNEENKSKCNCDSDCTCGCQDGEECTCDETCTCGCQDEKDCTCDNDCQCDGNCNCND